MTIWAALFDAVMWVSAFCLGILAVVEFFNTAEHWVNGKSGFIAMAALRFFGFASMSMTVVLMLIGGDA